MEIDRLVQVSTLQKRKIAELECQMVSGKFEKISSDPDMDRCKKRDRCYETEVKCGTWCHHDTRKERRAHSDNLCVPRVSWNNVTFFNIPIQVYSPVIIRIFKRIQYYIVGTFRFLLVKTSAQKQL